MLSYLARQLWRIIRNQREPKILFSSDGYWEERYASGDNSGIGSYDKLAEFKAGIINHFVTEHNVTSVIDFGCGDGNQLQYANYQDYLGLDVSKTAISLCKQKFIFDSNKKFALMQEYEGEVAELALSLDVIYHLVEFDVFNKYMTTLFNAASRYVIIYSSNFEDNEKQKVAHVNHRMFTKWIENNLSDWMIKHIIPNKYPTVSSAEFFIYEKNRQ